VTFFTKMRSNKNKLVERERSMSSLWLNIRILLWHIQVGDPHWYSVRLKYNRTHIEEGWPDGWFSRY
jgi:hypothetical protein